MNEQQPTSFTVGATTTPQLITNVVPAGERPAPPAAEPKPEERKFTQSDIDRAIEARLARERDNAERKASDARAAAELEKAKAAGEWQAVAERHQGRVSELEAISGQYDAQLEAYQKALRKHNRARIAAWPEAARNAIPHGEDDDPLDVAEQIDRWSAAVEQMPRAAGAPTTRAFGHAGSPAPVGGVPETAALDAEKTRLRSGGRYSP